MYKSMDGGLTWLSHDRGLTGTVVTALAVDPGSPTTIYAGTYYNGGLFRSCDGGLTWAPDDEGLTSHSVIAVATNASTSPSTVYVAETIGGAFLNETPPPGSIRPLPAPVLSPPIEPVSQRR